jgi:hypothetical protein
MKKKLLNVARMAVALKLPKTGGIAAGNGGTKLAVLGKNKEEEHLLASAAANSTHLLKKPQEQELSPLDKFMGIRVATPGSARAVGQPQLSPPSPKRSRLNSRGMTDSVADDSPSASIHHGPGTAGGDKSARVKSARGETPGGQVAVLKANSSTLDFAPPTDNSSIAKKKSVGNFISKLKDRVSKSGKFNNADSLLPDILGDDDSESSSVISSYFDRNAAPIFVERDSKVEKHILHSKRFEKPTSGDGELRRGDAENFLSRSRSNTYDDVAGAASGAAGKGASLAAVPGGANFAGIAGMPAAGTGVKIDAGPGSNMLAGGIAGDGGMFTARGTQKILSGENGTGGGSDVGAEPIVIKSKPLFDLQKFVASLSDEEKEILGILDQTAINKIIDGLNVRIIFLLSLVCVFFQN